MAADGTEAVPEPEKAKGGADASLLPDLVTRLATGLDELYRFLHERQVDAEALRRDVEELQRTRASFASVVVRVEAWLRERSREDEPVEAAMKRVSNLERRVDALQGQMQASAATFQHAAAADTANERIERALDALSTRQDELHAEIAHLTAWVETVERQETAVSRIINLLVERSRLIDGEDAGAGRGSG